MDARSFFYPSHMHPFMAPVVVTSLLQQSREVGKCHSRRKGAAGRLVLQLRQGAGKHLLSFMSGRRCLGTNVKKHLGHHRPLFYNLSVLHSLILFKVLTKYIA